MKIPQNVIELEQVLSLVKEIYSDVLIEVLTLQHYDEECDQVSDFIDVSCLKVTEKIYVKTQKNGKCRIINYIYLKSCLFLNATTLAQHHYLNH